MALRLTKLVGISLLCCTTLVNAEEAAEFVAPQVIEFDKTTYHLTDSATMANRKMFEYMVDGETVDAWKTLITISYFMNTTANAEKLKSEQEKSINLSDILSRQFILKKDRLYTMIAYKPIDPTGTRLEETAYEANVGKAFFNNSCSGVAVIEFARRVPANTANIQLAMKNNLKQIYQKLAVLPWQPSCKTAASLHDKVGT